MKMPYTEPRYVTLDLFCSPHKFLLESSLFTPPSRAEGIYSDGIFHAYLSYVCLAQPLQYIKHLRESAFKHKGNIDYFLSKPSLVGCSTNCPKSKGLERFNYHLAPCYKQGFRCFSLYGLVEPSRYLVKADSSADLKPSLP
jgi:hypothetical protein